jgi:hypothetical protein
MASTGQALPHSPQRMHSFFLTTTPPPFLCEKAPVGQARAQGAGSQARQVMASKPVERPPVDRILIPAVSQESCLCTKRAQARNRSDTDTAHTRCSTSSYLSPSNVAVCTVSCLK